MQGMTQDQMRARLFPFSLLGRALQWFYSLPPRTVQNWVSLMKEFMTEFYSPGKTQILRNKIATFAQSPTETIAEAYERFNDYIRAVPHDKFSSYSIRWRTMTHGHHRGAYNYSKPWAPRRVYCKWNMKKC